VPTPPASQTVYTNDPAVVFGASYSGSLPLHYQWQHSATTNEGGFTNLTGAIASAYTLAFPALSAAGYYRVVVHNIAGFATSAPPALLTVLTPLTSVTVTQVWTLAAGSRSYLDSSSYNTRGLAYDTNTQTVLVCDHQNIYVLAATNGSDLFTMNSLGVFNGGLNGWLYDQIGVADDGAVYGANLIVEATTGFSITRWDSVSPSAALNQAYGGLAGSDPGSGSGDRWGDTMDVRGSGTNTEIIIGSYSGTNVVLFTTPDGSTFTANLIAVTNVPAGFSGQGIAFGPGDTFYTKSPGYLFRQVAFDRGTWIAGAAHVFTTMPSAFDGIGVDVSASVLGGVNFSDTPNDLQLYLLSGNTNPPSLFDQAFFGSANVNSQFNAVTTLKGGTGFALDVNNGLVAIQYQVPPVLPLLQPTISAVAYLAGTGVRLTWNSIPGRSYQVEYTTALGGGSWTNIGPVIPTSGTTSTYTDLAPADASRLYRIQVQ
jgi:hypothetical protein